MASASTISLGIEVTGAEAFKAALKACDAESKALSAELTRLSQSTSLLDKGLPGMAQKFTALNQSLENNKAKLQLLTAEYERQEQVLHELEEALRRAIASGDPAAIERARAAFEKQRQTMMGLSQNISKTKQDADEAEKSLKSMVTGAIVSGFESLKNVAGQLAQGFAAVAKAAAEAASAIIDKMDQAVKGMALAGTALVGALGKIGVEYNMQMENYVTNFATMLGGTEAAVKKVEELKQMAAKTPFGMEDLAQATQTLLSFGIEANKTTPILKALGDVSLGNKEKFQSLALAFGQVSSSGKLTGQDLNQMINAGFNPLNEISQRTGESMEQLRERMSQGGISAKEVEQAFIDATSAGGQFANGMEAASKTTQGMISTLKDNATALVGRVFEPISNSIKNELLPAALGYVEQLTNAFEKDGLPGLINAVGDCLDQIMTKVETSGPQIINQVFEVVSQIINRLNQSLPEMVRIGTQLMQNIMDGLRTTLPQLGPIAAQIAPLVVQTIVEYKSTLLNAGIEIITQIIQGLAKEAPRIVSTITTCMDDLIRTITTCLPQFLDAAGQIIMSIADGLLKNGEKAVNAISDVIVTTVRWITDNLDKFLDAAAQILKTICDSINNNASQVVQAVSDMITAAAKWITDNMGLFLSAAIEIIVTVVKGILESLPQAVEAIGQVIKAMVDWVLTNLDIVLSAAVEIIIALVKGIIQSIPKAVDAITQILSSMINYLIGHLDEVISTAIKIILALAGGLIQAIPQLLVSVAQVVGSILTALWDLVKKIPEIGINIVKGLWEGIKSMASWIGDQVAGFFGGIIDGAKKLLGIQSPSRVFAGIGENIGLGLAEGIRDSAGVVQAAMDYITPTAGNVTMGMDATSVAGRVAAGNDGWSPWVDNRPIILTLNDRELGRAVRGYV